MRVILSLVTILVAGLAAQETPAPASIPQCPVEQDEFRNPGHMVRPQYPGAALKAGIQGSVRLRAIVGTDRKTKSLTVLSGPDTLVKPSLDAVRKWHFHPVLIKSQPAETIYTIEMRFNLLLQEAIPDITLESPRQPEPSLPDLPEVSDATIGTVYRATPGSGITGPKVIRQIGPEFSEEARQTKERGKVAINFVVGIDGSPVRLRVRCGAPFGLTEKALDAVKQWKFSPGTKDGQPVPVDVDVEVEFKTN